MKNISVLTAIFLFLGCFTLSNIEAATNELSRSTREIKNPKTGLKYLFLEDYSSNGIIILRSTQVFKEDRLVSAYRQIYTDNRVSVEEWDEDGDGRYETLIVFPGNDIHSIQAFELGDKGMVKPVSPERITYLRANFEKKRENDFMMRLEIEKATKP